MHEAADEARRARRCAPVQAALQRRRDLQYCEDADAAARRIQAEWRTRQMRLWCQRADRSARRLQRWTRRRWLRQRLEREVPIERQRHEALKKRLANAPPMPPSQRPQKTSARTTAAAGGQAEEKPFYAPKGSSASAMFACPPPTKKPGAIRQRSHSSCAANVLEASGALPMSVRLPASQDRGQTTNTPRTAPAMDSGARGTTQVARSSYRGARAVGAVS